MVKKDGMILEQISLQERRRGRKKAFINKEVRDDYQVYLSSSQRLQPNERWRRHHINLSQFYQKPRSRWCQRQDTGSPISHKKELKEGLCKMNQNEPIFLNLYIRDTESYRKITKIIGNKQIMGVKKLISFYENQHFFTLLFVHNFLSR